MLEGAKRRLAWSVLFSVPSVTIAFFLRIEPPRRARTGALWTMRSQIASAVVASPIAWWQLFVGSWHVMTVGLSENLCNWTEGG
jgi:hypothetical protein